MNYLKHLFRDLVELFRMIVRLPWMLAELFERRKQQADADANETERLDRIRNPSKYLGRD